MTSKIILRFAPSPTGYLHVGGARTAIFNWLYARTVGGRFLLRIEDTDKNRSSDEMTREILNGLRWLGLDWDNEPWIQSAHADRHHDECMRLLAEGKAYYCYCTQDILDAKRKTSEAGGPDYRYDRTCMNLTHEQRQDLEAAGTPRVLRFKVPEGTTDFYDIVHEETRFSNSEIDDFIILRTDGSPVYMVAVVVDDHDMGITHVIRGDDHLSNTPKQILLYEALGYDLPMFGHVPLILGADKKRLSKRHGATSVGEYQTRGILPQALFNFLALLGWSPGYDREVMSRDEIIDCFDVRRLLKGSSVFDEEKLLWMNGQHIRLLTDDELAVALHQYDPFPGKDPDPEYVRQVIPLMKERLTLLSDFFVNGQFFFEDPHAFDHVAVQKHWKNGMPARMAELADILETMDFDAEALETLIRGKAEEWKLSAGKLIHPIRLALTGGTTSPGLFEMMVVLGREACIRRLRFAVAKISVPQTPAGTE